MTCEITQFDTLVTQPIKYTGFTLMTYKSFAPHG